MSGDSAARQAIRAQAFARGDPRHIYEQPGLARRGRATLVPRRRPPRRNPVLRPPGSAHISLTARRATRRRPERLPRRRLARRTRPGPHREDERMPYQMIDSTGLGHVGHERAAREAEPVVDVDAGGERQDPLCDAGSEVGEGARPVALEREDVLEALEDGLDALADRGEVEPVVGLVLARRPQDEGSQLADRGLEFAARVALVADDRLAAAERPGQQLEGDLAFGPVGWLEGERSRGAVGGEHAVQAHAPEETAVRAAVAVAAGVGELGAAGGLERAAALDRRRVEQHEVVVEAGALAGEDTAEPVDRLGKAPAALVEAGLLRQLREQVREPLAGHGQKATVAWHTHDGLRHAERDDLRVCDPATGVAWLLRQQIVRRAENGDEEQVKVGVHRGLPVDGDLDTADFDHSSTKPSITAPAVESVI